MKRKRLLISAVSLMLVLMLAIPSWTPVFAGTGETVNDSPAVTAESEKKAGASEEDKTGQETVTDTEKNNADIKTPFKDSRESENDKNKSDTDSLNPADSEAEGNTEILKEEPAGQDGEEKGEESKNICRVTVRYLDESGNELKQSEERSFTEGTQYDVRDLLVDHYTADGEAVFVDVGDDYQFSWADEALTGTITSDLVINAYFEKPEEPAKSETEPADINKDDYRNDDLGYRDYDGDDGIPVPVVPNTPKAGGATGVERNSSAESNTGQQEKTAKESRVPVVQPEEQTELENTEVPLAKTDGAWALLNLLMAAVAAVLSAGMILFSGKKEEDNETDRRGLMRLLSIIPAAGGIILFILTEDMSLPVKSVDRWTPFMTAILIVQAAVTLMSVSRNKDGDDSEGKGVKA